MNTTADSAQAYIKQRRPVPPATIVAVGRLTAEERDELTGLRAAVKRIRVDLSAAEEREARLQRRIEQREMWIALLFFLVILAMVAR